MEDKREKSRNSISGVSWILEGLVLVFFFFF